MSPTRRELVNATRNRILTAASRLMRSRGARGFSMDVLAKEAGVARATVYEHFSSKDDVLVKLVRAVSEQVADEIAPLFDGGERPIDDVYREALDTWMHMGARYGPLLVAATEEWPRIPEQGRSKI